MAELHLMLKEGTVILPGSTLHSIMVRIKDLIHGFAGIFASPAAAGSLHQKIKCTLTAAEIIAGHAGIAVNDTNKRHIRIIQSFGYHLGAKQNVCLTPAKGSQQFLMGILV